MRILNTHQLERFTVKMRVMHGAQLADRVLADVTEEDWYAHVLVNVDIWKDHQVLHPIMEDPIHNIFAYMGAYLDAQTIFIAFGFTRWRELYTFGFWPEGRCTKVDEKAELRNAWLHECRWRNAFGPPRTIRTVLEEVRPLRRP